MKTCSKGHPFTPENRQMRADGYTFCVACRKLAGIKQRAGYVKPNNERKTDEYSAVPSPTRTH